MIKDKYCQLNLDNLFIIKDKYCQLNLDQFVYY